MRHDTKIHDIQITGENQLVTVYTNFPTNRERTWCHYYLRQHMLFTCLLNHLQRMSHRLTNLMYS